METSQQQIVFGKVVLRILDLLIIRFFVLPYKIYKNALVALSNANNEQSEETVLSSDFPLYTWYLNIFNAIIGLSYPLGILGAIGAVVFTSSYGFGGGGFGAFLGAVIITYFVPLWLGLLKEFLQIPLKVLLYLKITANK